MNELAAAPYGPAHIWHQWEFDPLVIAALVTTLALYLLGSRSSSTGAGVPRGRRIAFLGGWITACISLVSPLHAAGLQLFSAHMTQHVLLMLVAAPLLMLSRPFSVMLRGCPAEVTRAVSALRRSWLIRLGTRVAAVPVAAWSIHFIALWVWHVPSLFEGAVTSETLHALEHACFFGSALVFWAVPIRLARRRAGAGVGVLYVFTTGMHNALLGVLLSFASEPWYGVYGLTAPMWGLTPLEDQQIGGLIMWIPSGLAYLAAAALLLAVLLRPSESKFRPDKPALAALVAARADEPTAR